jgi:hypothetical protein
MECIIRKRAVNICPLNVIGGQCPHFVHPAQVLFGVLLMLKNAEKISFSLYIKGFSPCKMLISVIKCPLNRFFQDHAEVERNINNVVEKAFNSRVLGCGHRLNFEFCPHFVHLARLCGHKFHQI